MATYLLVDENLEIRATDNKAHPHPTGHPTWRWLKRVETKPPHNPNTELLEAPVVTATATEYRITYSKRPLTGPELAALKQARAQDFLNSDHLIATALIAIIAAIKDPAQQAGLPDDEIELKAWLEAI